MEYDILQSALDTYNDLQKKVSSEMKDWDEYVNKKFNIIQNNFDGSYIVQYKNIIAKVTKHLAYSTFDVINENTVRKVDELGRVVLPKGLRNRFNIAVGEELAFYTLTSPEYGDLIAVGKVNPTNDFDDYTKAYNLLTKLRLPIPDELLIKMRG